jgi:hypothetical protein
MQRSHRDFFTVGSQSVRLRCRAAFVFSGARLLVADRSVGCEDSGLIKLAICGWGS